jgi:hypothetical protein
MTVHVAELPTRLSHGLVRRESSTHEIRRSQLEVMLELRHHLGFETVALSESTPERAGA